MRVIVTGGGGFLGSHLCEALLARGDTVVCVDDFSTGHAGNVAHLAGNPSFRLVRCDVTDGLEPADEGGFDAVAHLASPASPPDYLGRPLETLAAGSRGTEHALRLAHRHRARFVLASTSEVYGDPAEHPQREEYWGNVNPVGPRSVYDEAKRYAEALSMAYRRTLAVDCGVLRIFNTYGPRMRPDDGRVVSNFLTQALRGRPLTVYGDGTQTRSLCYVQDLVRGITAMIDTRGEAGPVNLGNPEEYTVAELALLVREITGTRSPVEYRPLPVDDPVRRRPSVSRARRRLGWAPQVPVPVGLRLTAQWYSEQLSSPAEPGAGPAVGTATDVPHRVAEPDARP